MDATTEFGNGAGEAGEPPAEPPAEQPEQKKPGTYHYLAAVIAEDAEESVKPAFVEVMTVEAGSQEDAKRKALQSEGATGDQLRKAMSEGRLVHAAIGSKFWQPSKPGATPRDPVLTV